MEDLVLPVGLELVLLGEIDVRETAVGESFYCHPRRVQRDELRTKATIAGNDPRVAVSVERRMVAHNFQPFVLAHPTVRPLAENAVDRQIRGQLLAAVWHRPKNMQRHGGD